MQLNRDEYMLLSRGGRVPRSSRARPPASYLVEQARQAARPARRRERLARALSITVSRARVGGPSRSR
jgi:hypothetical protein